MVGRHRSVALGLATLCAAGATLGTAARGHAQALITTAAATVHLSGVAGPPDPSCAGTSTALSGFGVGAFQFTNIDGFAGQLGYAGAACNLASGAGALQLSVSGGSFGGCPSLTGSFVQVGAIMMFTVAGPCTVNNFTSNPMTFTSVGVVSNVTGFTYDGVMASAQDNGS
jgi:hypothetical protein